MEKEKDIESSPNHVRLFCMKYFGYKYTRRVPGYSYLRNIVYLYHNLKDVVNDKSLETGSNPEFPV